VWIFFIFRPSKICVNPTDIISFISPPDAASPLSDYATSCHASFSWSQDKLNGSASSRRRPLGLKPKNWIRTTATGHPH
jgi:hypothetical protein